MTFVHGCWEVNPDSTEEVGLCVNIGSNFNVEIDKLYGPLAAETIRVRVESASGEWVIERQRVDTDVWEEKARWDCQESWPEETE